MTSQRYPDLDPLNYSENGSQDTPVDASRLQMLPYFMPNEHEMNFMMHPNPMLPQFPYPPSQNFHDSSVPSSFQAPYGQAPSLPAVSVPNNDFNLNYIQSYPPATVQFPSAFIPNMAMYMPMYVQTSMIPYVMNNFHTTSSVSMSGSSATAQTAATVRIPMAEVDISTTSVSIPTARGENPATSTSSRTTPIRNLIPSTNSRTVSSLIPTIPRNSTTSIDTPTTTICNSATWTSAQTITLRNLTTSTITPTATLRSSITSIDIPTASTNISTILSDIPATTTATNVPTTSFRNSTTGTPKLVNDNVPRTTKSITIPLALIRIPRTVSVQRAVKKHQTMDAASKESQKVCPPNSAESLKSRTERWNVAGSSTLPPHGIASDSVEHDVWRQLSPTLNATEQQSSLELQSSHSQDDSWTLSQFTEPSSCERSLLLPVHVSSAKQEYKKNRIYGFQTKYQHCEPKDNLEDMLRSLCSRVSDPGCSDSVILTRAVERIRQLKAIIISDEEGKNDLRQYIEELNDRIELVLL
uniref:BHLH domain-containing protein n=1 Tax=Setaria digitata TaxID=48799 RepID=A0A915PF66_9BILA